MAGVGPPLALGFGRERGCSAPGGLRIGEGGREINIRGVSTHFLEMARPWADSSQRWRRAPSLSPYGDGRFSCSRSAGGLDEARSPIGKADGVGEAARPADGNARPFPKSGPRTATVDSLVHPGSGNEARPVPP